MPPEADPQQQQIVDHASGPLLVTGPVGTGKTWALAERFARLIEGGADPERVVLMVRSKGDRLSLRRALFERLGSSMTVLNVLTAHALADQVLSRRWGNLDYDEPPVVLSASEQFALIEELLAGQEASAWKAYGSLLPLGGFAEQVRNFILRAQESLLEPEEIASRAQERGLTGWGEVATFYREYLDVLDHQGRVDFAGMVRQAAAVIAEGDPLFDHVMVDDYQDSTIAIEALIAGARGDTLVVAGDIDAHVFSFQGTTSLPLQRFAGVMGGAPSIALTELHRAPSISLEARLAVHASEEARMIARELRRTHVQEGVPWSDMAVVVRRQGSTFQGLLRALDDADVPRRTTETWTALTSEPATAPYVLALRWLGRPNERGALVEALLTSDLAGLSPAAARGLLRAGQVRGLSPTDALELDDGLTAEEASTIAALRSVLERAQDVAERSVAETFRILWRELDRSAAMVAQAQEAPDAANRRDLDAIRAFGRMIAAASEAGDVPVSTFIDSLGTEGEGPGFSADGQASDDAVRVLTAHAAAGTEFDTVVIAGAVEGDFPSLSRPEPMFDLAVLDAAMPQSTRNRLRLEDERRLFKMVVGRARRRVLLTASDSHDLDAVITSRSRFAGELGLEWTRPSGRPAVEHEPISQLEAAAVWRSRLADLSAPAAERLAALEGLLALERVDPDRWWFQRDWSTPPTNLRDSVSTSYSRLSTLENCELQFVLSQELGLGGRAGYQAWAGKLFHKLIEQCEDGLIERTEEALKAEAMKRWRQQEFPSFAVSEEFKRLMVEQMIPHWMKQYGGQAAAAREKWFEFELDGAKVHGYIDRIGEITSGGFRITDYKTGKPTDLTKGGDNLQLGIYWMGVENDPDLAAYRPVRAAELAFVRGDKGQFKSAPWQPHGRDIPEWLAAMEQRTIDLIRRLRDLYAGGQWRPSTQADCYFCEFKSMCSLYPEGRPLFGKSAAKASEGTS